MDASEICGHIRRLHTTYLITILSQRILRDQATVVCHEESCEDLELTIFATEVFNLLYD